MPSITATSTQLVPLSDEELLSQSPFLTKLSRRRLAPVRMSQLCASARSTKPPKEPEPWECCGSSCKPCVRELWREEKRVWDECHPDGEDVESEPEEQPELEERAEEGPAIEIGIEEQLESCALTEEGDAAPVGDRTGEQDGE
ncbi:hypothetical protein JCM3766R1_000862 [Sporobolomyces carnicolor]